MATPRPDCGRPLEHLDVVAPVADGHHARAAASSSYDAHPLERDRLVDAVGRDVEPGRPADVVADAMQAHLLDDGEKVLDRVLGRDHDDAGRGDVQQLRRTRPCCRSPRCRPRETRRRRRGTSRPHPRPRNAHPRGDRGWSSAPRRVERLDVVANVSARRIRLAAQHDGAVRAHDVVGARCRVARGSGSVMATERPVRQGDLVAELAHPVHRRRSPRSLRLPSSRSTVPSTSSAMSQRAGVD